MVDRRDLVGPVLPFLRRAVEDRVTLVAVDIGQGAAVALLMGHVVHARLDVDDGLERRMPRDVLDSLTVDPDFAAVANAVLVRLARADHHSLHIALDEVCDAA